MRNREIDYDNKHMLGRNVEVLKPKAASRSNATTH